MNRKKSDNHELLQRQLDRLVKDVQNSAPLSQALLGSLTGLLDLSSENQALTTTYAHVHKIIGDLVELDKGKDLEHILSEIATVARSLLEVDSVVITPTTSDGITFLPEFVTIAGQGKKYFRIPEKSSSTGVTAYLISSPSGQLHVHDCSDRKSFPFLDLTPNSYLSKAGINSFLGFRLGNRAKIYGFLFINRTMMGNFTEEQTRLAELFGALISIALQIHSSIDTLVEPGHTEALQKIQLAINAVTDSEAEIDLQQFLFNLLDTALLITGAKKDGFGFVALVEKVENVLRINVHVGPKDTRLTTVQIGKDDEPPHGITGWVARTGLPALVDDVQNDERYRDGFSRRTISELAVPLRIKASVIGVINLESPQPRAFNKNHLSLLEGLANLASIAIHLIRRRQAQHDNSAIANVIITSRDTHKTLNKFYDYVQARTQARDVAILSYDVDRNVLHLDEFPYRASSHAKHILEVPFGEGVTGNAAKLDKVIYIEDVQEIFEGKRGYIPWLNDTRANMAIPLKIGERLIGVLDIESPVPYAFTDVDEDQLLIMASFAAISLENAKRYQSTVNFQTSSEFVGLFVSKFHDLFGNTIKPAAVKLESLELKLLENKGNQTSRAIQKSLAQEIRSIREIIDDGIRDARELASSAKEAEEITTNIGRQRNGVFEESLSLALSQLSMSSGIQLVRKYDEDVALLSVLGPVHDIFRNLLKNSIGAIGKVGGKGVITISAEKRHGWLYFVVEDTGCGIPEREVRKIFDIGYSGGIRGLGLGLHVTRQLVELFGGKLILKNGKPGKTAFAFSLPITDNGEGL